MAPVAPVGPIPPADSIKETSSIRTDPKVVLLITTTAFTASAGVSIVLYISFHVLNETFGKFPEAMIISCPPSISSPSLLTNKICIVTWGLELFPILPSETMNIRDCPETTGTICPKKAYGWLLKNCAEYLPEWAKVLITDVFAEAQPVRLPVSKPPFTITSFTQLHSLPF
ncbi:hypothetical protein BSSC8_25210 [Bacillus subtilis subsp. subtilis str. SC-8]|nr:hypothetical protein BSSC8_25210 [Bacillus subtilis subsp. subtilis str. SC-8]